MKVTDMRTTASEDYLKAIYELQREGSEPVSTTSLAHRLGVAPASVTDMVQKLAAQHLLNYEPYMGVTLSASGEQCALEVLRRHEVLERYLVGVVGVSPETAHETAEQWEHNLSREVERRLADLGGGQDS